MRCQLPRRGQQPLQGVKVGEGAGAGGVATTGDGVPVLGACSSDSGC